MRLASRHRAYTDLATGMVALVLAAALGVAAAPVVQAAAALLRAAS